MYSCVLNDDLLSEHNSFPNSNISTKRSTYDVCSISHPTNCMNNSLYQLKREKRDCSNDNDNNEFDNNDNDNEFDNDDNYLMGNTQETFSPTVLETLMRNMTVQSCIPEVMLCLKEVEPFLHAYHPPLFTREQYCSLLTCTMSHKSLKSIRNQLLAIQSKIHN